MFLGWIHDKIFLTDFPGGFRCRGYLLTKTYL